MIFHFKQYEFYDTCIKTKFNTIITINNLKDNLITNNLSYCLTITNLITTKISHL